MRARSRQQLHLLAERRSGEGAPQIRRVPGFKPFFPEQAACCSGSAVLSIRATEVKVAAKRQSAWCVRPATTRSALQFREGTPRAKLRANSLAFPPAGKAWVLEAKRPWLAWVGAVVVAACTLIYGVLIST